ncbi:hypothetical protein TNCV_2177921 [Trichonephila clavipes]|uniref:Uncharacterized protein n=1 Tax=Trichonephila clavipes TaxID=2585209 RepID=A0A8X7B7S5_TRICX|nr:hypothetical protein TNCV_2177921 [Trichonephila clavipes]
MVSDETEFAVGDIERLFEEARRNTKSKPKKWEKYYNRSRRDVQTKRGRHNSEDQFDPEKADEGTIASTSKKSEQEQTTGMPDEEVINNGRTRKGACTRKSQYPWWSLEGTPTTSHKNQGDSTYSEKVDMYLMYGVVNGNGRAALRLYQGLFPVDACGTTKYFSDGCVKMVHLSPVLMVSPVLIEDFMTNTP